MNNSAIYNSNDNRQMGFQGPQAMMTVRSTKQAISNVHAIVGGALLGAGALVFAPQFFIDHNAAVLALQITGGSLALSGIIEMIISAFFRRSARREQEKLDRLKAEGQSFSGKIIKIERVPYMNFGRSNPVYIECSYENHEGKTCLVKSKSILRTHSCGDYSAWVYVNPHNPHDYAVEIFTHAAEAQGFYDYR
ncbi:MAG: hypothetical protein FWC76_07160 [Defluviitaleaceae bacterium]|nr:hypothetical protein [Defluviitaleaceae bacterium]